MNLRGTMYNSHWQTYNMIVIIPIASYEDSSAQKRHKCAVTVTLRHYQSHFPFFENSSVHTASQSHTASSWQATLQPYFRVLAQWSNTVAGLVVANSFISWMRKINVCIENNQLNQWAGSHACKVRNPRIYLEEGNYSILCVFLCDKFCSCDQVFTKTWSSGNDVNCNRGGLASNHSLTLDGHGIVE